MLQDCKILVTEISMSSNSDSAETSRNMCSRTLAGVMRCDAMTEVQPWTRAIRQRRNTRRSLPDSSLPLDLGPRLRAPYARIAPGKSDLTAGAITAVPCWRPLQMGGCE